MIDAGRTEPGITTVPRSTLKLDGAQFSHTVMILIHGWQVQINATGVASGWGGGTLDQDTLEVLLDSEALARIRQAERSATPATPTP